jgi:hypothetical protein
VDNERPGDVGDGDEGLAGGGDDANFLREVVFAFEQLENLVRATKERAASLALSYRGLDPLVLSARFVDLAEAVGAVQDASSVTAHHLRNCAVEVITSGG